MKSSTAFKWAASMFVMILYAIYMNSEIASDGMVLAIVSNIILAIWLGSNAVRDKNLVKKFNDLTKILDVTRRISDKYRTALGELKKKKKKEDD